MLILLVTLWNTRHSLSKNLCRQNSSFTWINYRMFYMFFDLHYDIWFCVVEICQFIFLSNIIMLRTYLNKSQTTFQALLGNSGLTMMTSSKGNNLRVTGHLWGEFTGHRWIPLTKASDAELWCFLWATPGQTVEQTLETPVIWDTIVLIMTSL